MMGKMAERYRQQADHHRHNWVEKGYEIRVEQARQQERVEAASDIEKLEARIAELEAENARLASELAEAKAAQPTAPSGDWREHRMVRVASQFVEDRPDKPEGTNILKHLLDALPAIIDAECAKAVAQAVEEAWAKETPDV